MQRARTRWNVEVMIEPGEGWRNFQRILDITKTAVQSPS